jgi:hypothetical protein
MKVNIFLFTLLSLRFILVGSTTYISHQEQEVIDIKNDSLNTNSRLVYHWINSPKRPNDYYSIDDFSNVLGSVKSIREYVVNKNDSMRQLVRIASYDLNRNLCLLSYQLSNDISSDEIMESKETSSIIWQYQFVYTRKRVKNEIRLSCESGILNSKKMSKKNSLFKIRQPQIIKKNKKTGLVLEYQLLNENCSWGPETVFCEYDSLNRKTKSVVKNSIGEIRSTTKVEYFDSQIIETVYSPHQEKKTTYKLDSRGNWIEKTVIYPNNNYGVDRHKRIISYY